MNNIKLSIIIFLVGSVFFSCNKDNEVIGTNVSDLLWLENKGAQMPILVEGNTTSKTFILILHGGPGGTSTSYNESNLEMSQTLEEKYAVAYWDQRLSGNSKGQLSDDEFSVALMIEDTDKVIDLLKFRYGQDISIFLLGHSWGGYLGNAYLSQSVANQQKVRGWIDVAGAHNIKKVIRDGLTLMEEIASQQISSNSKKKNDWKKILDYVQDVDSIGGVNKDFSLEVNEKAGEAIDIAGEDNLINRRKGTGSETVSTFFRDNHFLNNIFNAGQMGKSDIWENILRTPLSDDLEMIQTPALLLWGKYDFVVPPSLGEEAFEKLGTPNSDKSFHIFETSGHSPMFAETDKFLDLVVRFVEDYK